MSKKPKNRKAEAKDGALIANLEKIFNPCKIRKNSKPSSGFDFSLEIINPLTNRDRRLVSGKKFYIALCQSISKRDLLKIEAAQIEKWQKITRPLMLICHKGAQIKFVWLDQSFYARLRTIYQGSWIGRKQIDIPLTFFQVLQKPSVPSIENYINSFSSSKGITKPLPKSAFFDIRTELRSEIGSFLEYLKKNNLQQSESRLDELLNRTENAIYTISIVGPSRTGKSTLINALVKENISPVDTLPTTGVPVTIQPGKKRRASVMFQDGRTQEGAAEIKFLEKYIDQKHNPKNNKQVKLVTVYLLNDFLEKGLAYCDVPGLDDANPEIRRVSKIAVYSSNAIIYLIDASSYKYGGFSINSHHLEDLRELAPKMDRVYLVFNKVDILSSKQLSELKHYINKVLEENDLKKHLPSAPLYISARQSYDNIRKPRSNKGAYDISILENVLWENLLKTNKSGLFTLGGITYEIREELNHLTKILSSRLIDGQKNEKLGADLKRIGKQLNNLSNVADTDRRSMLEWLKTHIKGSVNEKINALEQELRSIPSNSPLPSSYAIRQYLESHAYAILTEIYDEVNYKLDSTYHDLNYWVKQELSQVEFLSEENYEPLRDKNAINDIIRPIRDSFSQTLPSALNMLEKIFEFVGDIIVGVFNFFERIFIGQSGVRQKQINQIMTRARSSFTKVFQQTHSDFSRHINNQFTIMINQLRDRTQVYFGQINQQLKNISSPPDQSMSGRITACLEEIETRKTNIERIKNVLIEYTNVSDSVN